MVKLNKCSAITPKDSWVFCVYHNPQYNVNYAVCTVDKVDLKSRVTLYSTSRCRGLKSVLQLTDVLPNLNG